MSFGKHPYLAFDVVVIIDDKRSPLKKKAKLTRELIEVLVSIHQTKSIAHTCKRLNFSERHIQRMVKEFEEASSLKLLEHHGPNGTGITPDAHRCIALYNSCLTHTNQVAYCTSHSTTSSKQPSLIRKSNRPIHQTLQVIKRNHCA